MSIIEILDSENIGSNLETWKEECDKFRDWFFKSGARHTEEAMATAYQKIEPKFKLKNQN